MVSAGAIIGIVITLFISLILPILILIIFGVKNKQQGIWSAWGLGALGFFVPQIIIRLPILNSIASSEGYKSFAKNHYVVYCFVLAFTAGLFELVGRYVVAKVIAKKFTFKRGIAAGLGHGGIEAMILIGMTYINNLIYAVMINTGGLDATIESLSGTGIDTNQLVNVKEAMLSTNASLFYFAGYERILTMIGHVALSLIVCYFVVKKKDAIGLLICLGLHFILDFVSVIISGMSTQYLGNVLSDNMALIITYVFLTVMAVIFVFIIMKIRKNIFTIELENEIE